jgi:rhodanese-related sulfurtransferase
MYRRNRNRERRYHRHRRDDYKNYGRGITSLFRRPSTQITVLVVVALVIYLLLQAGRNHNNAAASVPPVGGISVSEAFNKYQSGAFVLDVRTVEEWNQSHIPGAAWVPLDQLSSHLNEIPKDKEIVVICSTATCSQQGRDLLLSAGFTGVSSMAGTLEEWRASGYPVEP